MLFGKTGQSPSVHLVVVAWLCHVGFWFAQYCDYVDKAVWYDVLYFSWTVWFMVEHYAQKMCKICIVDIYYQRATETSVLHAVLWWALSWIQHKLTLKYK